MANLRLIAAVLLAAAITGALAYLWQSQLEAPAGAIDSGFSEEHAYATLSKILAEQRPHSAGSPENAIVRDRIVAELKSAGYQPEIQSAVECGPPERNPGCTAVENIIAVHKGAGTGKGVLATAHYDSVPAGPGVSDDGAGAVVILELARFFADKQTKNDIIFLITDGEETGLRGAMAFARFGIATTPAPLRYDRPPRFVFDEFMPHASAVLNSYFALHEWIGIFYYALRS